VYPVTPHRGVRRLGRACASLTALGVLAGGVYAAMPDTGGVYAFAATRAASAGTAGSAATAAPAGTAQRSVATATAYQPPAAPTYHPATYLSAGYAAVTPTLRPTHTYLWSDAAVSHPGQSVRLTGKVTYTVAQARVRSQRIRLQVRNGTAWHTVGWSWLSGNGYVAFPVSPTATTAYRLVFPAVWPYAASVSVPEVITVTPWPRGTKAAQVVALAAAQVGKWYVFGAVGPSVFDCSGLTQYVFGKVGVWLPHFADSQQYYGVAVSAAAARPGDLVVFLSGGYGYHVGIYAGGGYMYDAPQPGQTVGRHQIWSTDVVYRRLV
jgi:cell wall-associated NlpC family hydrolase